MRRLTVQSTSGRTFTFVEQRPSSWNPRNTVAVWSAPCTACGAPFEVTSPRIDGTHGRVLVQMAIDSNAWARYFALARCPACRKARRA